MRPLLLLLGVGATSVLAGFSDPPEYPDGSDLESFITRPELRAPRYTVAKYHPEAVSPGYLFVTPYSNIAPQLKSARMEHMPCQTGPYIYDGDGILIWSGACQFENRNSFAFKPVHINGTQHLTISVAGTVLADQITRDQRKQSGVILNNRYQQVGQIILGETPLLDAHELKVLPSGKTALISTMWRHQKPCPEIGQGNRTVLNNGFQEIDLQTNQTIFNWDPFEHGVLVDESMDSSGKNRTEWANNAWDWFHINSVDKNSEGDYLVSGRHVSTIYKISGVDGHVIWRLGGLKCDFVMDAGVPFNWQHHARFRFQNETHTILSLFDNEAEDFNRNPDIPAATPSGKVVVLDTASQPMTAKLVRRFDRPDLGFSNALGSMQAIGDNIETASFLVNWAYEGYVGEYDNQDRLVFEARYQSTRMKTFRAYKFNFTGFPIEPPAFAVLPIGYGQNEVASAFYASWNGATEVGSWAFYGGDSEFGPFDLLATVE